VKKGVGLASSSTTYLMVKEDKMDKKVESITLCPICGDWMTRRWTGSKKIAYFIDYCPKCDKEPKIKRPQREIIEALNSILKDEKKIGGEHRKIKRIEYDLNMYSEPGIFLYFDKEYNGVIRELSVCYIRRFSLTLG